MTRRVGSKGENTRELTIAAAKIENEADLVGLKKHPPDCKFPLLHWYRSQPLVDRRFGDAAGQHLLGREVLLVE